MTTALLRNVSKDGTPGYVYWGDFLDLQAEGPVAWRKEIEDGIFKCSKVVAFLDEAWLTRSVFIASIDDR
jgi:hypothetical protein